MVKVQGVATNVMVKAKNGESLILLKFGSGYFANVMKLMNRKKSNGYIVLNVGELEKERVIGVQEEGINKGKFSVFKS